MTIPIAARPDRCDVFAVPLTADVLSICNDHLELVMPSHGLHQPGEACQVRFQLNGARRVLAFTPDRFPGSTSPRLRPAHPIGRQQLQVGTAFWNWRQS